MKAPLLIAALLAVSPLLVRAQDATTQPAAPVVNPAADITDVTPGPAANPAGNPGNPSPDDPHGRRRGGIFSHAGQRGLNQPPTEKELEDAKKFMEQHSPQRLKTLEAMPDGEEKTRIRNGAALAYVNWMRLANTDFELYKVVVQRIDLEDQIFGKFAQMRMDPADKQDTDKADLKVVVAKLVDNGIQERHLRLERLKKTIETEAKNLEQDEANRPQAVDDRLKAILNSGGGGLLPNPGPASSGGDKHPRGGQHGS